jgi:hypothetical protein
VPRKPKLPTFTLKRAREYNYVDIRAITKDRRFREPDRWTDHLNAHKSLPGEIGFVEIHQYGDGKVTSITKIVVRKELHRGGLGTRLYEAAARASCAEFNQPLSSDYQRTLAAQKFWEKQVRKGRAVCVRKGKTPREERNAGPDRSILGRGGCAVYRLKSCPAPSSLAGR